MVQDSILHVSVKYNSTNLLRMCVPQTILPNVRPS